MQSQEDLYAQLAESRRSRSRAHRSSPGACHLLSAALHAHLVSHFFYKTAQDGGVISPIFLSIWFARNCLSGEFYFSPLDLALSRNWSLFLAVLIAIFLNHSPVPPPHPPARSFAGFSLVGTFLYIFYSELPILLHFPPFLSTLQSQRHLSSGPLWLFSLPFPAPSFPNMALCATQRGCSVP